MTRFVIGKDQLGYREEEGVGREWRQEPRGKTAVIIWAGEERPGLRAR